MPVLKCGGGKYRIGSGPCMYKSKASAERAYRGYLMKTRRKAADRVLGTDRGKNG